MVVRELHVVFLVAMGRFPGNCVFGLVVLCLQILGDIILFELSMSVIALPMLIMVCFP